MIKLCLLFMHVTYFLKPLLLARSYMQSVIEHILIRNITDYIGYILIDIECLHILLSL